MGSSDRGLSDFIHTASSFVPSSSPSRPSEEHHQQNQHGDQHEHAGGSAGKKPPSPGDLLSSAKVIMDAAVSKMHKAEAESQEGNQVDKAKVAAAAADVLAAAKHYGKMDGKNYGKYVDKAEDYLKKYGGQGHGQGQVHTQAQTHAYDSTAPTPPSHFSTSQSSHSSAAHEENKYGKYLKKAEELLNKHKY